jgi:hypothetical protein
MTDAISNFRKNYFAYIKESHKVKDTGIIGTQIGIRTKKKRDIDISVKHEKG